MLGCFVLIFLFGIILGAYLPYFPILSLVILLLTALGFVFLEGRGTFTLRQGMIGYGGCLLGIMIWAVTSWADPDARLIEEADDSTHRIIGSVVEPVTYDPTRLIAVVAVDYMDGQPKTGRLRLTWREPDAPVRRGDRVHFDARVRAPKGTVNPGGFDYEAYLARKNITAVSSITGPGALRVQDVHEEGACIMLRCLWRMSETWRNQVRTAALRSLKGPAEGLYLGMIVGHQRYIPDDVREPFMATGTAHIIAISGTHLGLLAFLSFFLIRNGLRRIPAGWYEALSRHVTPTRLAAALTVAPVIFYTFLAGSRVGTVRALLMILLYLLAVWLGRNRDLLLALAMAALVILVHSPKALFEVSFQLSFLSVLAIALILRRMEPRELQADPAPSIRSKVMTWGSAYLVLTTTVSLATIPLIAFYFNQFPWLSLPANLVVVPLGGFLAVPVGLISAVWLLIAGGQGLPLASLNQVVFDALAAAAAVFAQIPGAVWRVASPSIPAIIVFYLFLLGVILWRGFKSGRVCCVIGIVLLLGWWAWSPRWTLFGDALRVTFLDVGQGDACVIELPRGETVLIDAGPAYETLDMGRAAVAPFLWDRGIRRLDHVIATHPQLDHIGGLPWILETFDVGEFWTPGIPRNKGFYDRLQQTLHAQGLEPHVAREGVPIATSGSCRFWVMNPSGHTRPVSSVSGRAGDLNNQSIVTKLECRGASFLFTADVERDAIGRLGPIRTTGEPFVLKVPHHGGRSSLDTGWLERIGPAVAVISVGRNPYGHPAPLVIDAYKRAGYRLFRTDRDGAVWVTRAPGKNALEVKTARSYKLRPVSLGSDVVADEIRNLHVLVNRWMGV